MDVYLFQLDSVRNSHAEIKTGQNALMEQMLVYGNTVVLTLNQLVDSMAFLQAIHDKDKFEVIKELINIGKIRVSSFIYTDENGRKRKYVSASDYFQSAIERIQADGENSKGKYHFSCCFIDEKDIVQVQLALNALRYSNPGIINDEIELIKAGKESEIVKSSETFFGYSNWDKEKKDQEIKVLHDIKRYVEVILLLSKNDNKTIPPRKNISCDHTMSGYLKRIQNIYANGSDKVHNKKDIQKDEQIQKLTQALQLLHKCEEEAEMSSTIDGNTFDPDKRSPWYRLIELKRAEMLENDVPDTEILTEYMQMIIDLCYNFTCEYSVSSINNSYSDKKDNINFQSEFENQLRNYIDLSDQHIFSWNENKSDISFVGTDNEEQNDWKTMWKIVKMNDDLENAMKKEISEKEQINAISNVNNVYAIPDNDPEAQKQYWQKLTRSGIRRERFSAIAYLLVFMLFQFFSNELQDLYNLGAAKLSRYFPGIPKTVGDLIIMIIMIVFLGFFTSWISKELNLPDILDSITLAKDSKHKNHLFKKAIEQSKERE